MKIGSLHSMLSLEIEEMKFSFERSDFILTDFCQNFQNGLDFLKNDTLLSA